MNRHLIKTRLGFTLSEVLITIVVIGIIAAITVPVIIENYRAEVLKTQKLKAKSSIANAMKLLLLESGANDIISAKLVECFDYSGNNKNTCLQTESKRIFNIVYDSIENPSLLSVLKSNTYKTAYDFGYSVFPAAYAHSGGDSVTPQIGSTSSPTNPWDNISYVFITGDGITYGYGNELRSEGDLLGFYIIADLNEKKRPNKVGEDLVQFFIDNIGNTTDRTCEYSSNCSSDIISGNTSQNNNNNNTGSGSNSGSSHSGGPYIPPYGGHSGGSTN